ncbi:MAG: hypothetical protein GY856_36835 [bacterium]|nr:hypothetical protein [bacterium]
MTAYILEYRCRRCGELFYGGSGGKAVIEQILVRLLDDEGVFNMGVPAGRTSHHMNCPAGGIGVGDLAGAREDKPAPVERICIGPTPPEDCAHRHLSIHEYTVSEDFFIECRDCETAWDWTREDMRGTIEEVEE